MHHILANLESPSQLPLFSESQLRQLAEEIRAELCHIADTRATHFASNLGAVELTIALHCVFDFRRDRLIWDTGHQVYSHKLLTGRYSQFHTLRQKNGLMGFPNPNESEYDLLMTGHAGSSVGTALGLACGDLLLRAEENRHSVAVIGDGALASGSVFEALNHSGELRKNFTVVLNDNKMSICPRVGGLSRYLDQLRMNRSYLSVKHEMQRWIEMVPYFNQSMRSFMSQCKDAIKAGFLGGMLFEEFGFRYLGPIDGHDIFQLRRWLQIARNHDEPVLLHVFTEKGRGFIPAENDPTMYHAPTPATKKNGDTTLKTAAENRLHSGKVVNEVDEEIVIASANKIANETAAEMSFTEGMAAAIFAELARNPKVCVITAAMCQGNMLEKVRDTYPDRFFDVGICESHAVNFAAGLAVAGMRPIVTIYSTFIQRSYDQLFQEVSLQNLPIVFALDRAGLAAADGPTHHGVFDIAFLRPFPNFTLMSPGDVSEIAPMLQFALGHNGPVAIRYPRCTSPLRATENIVPIVHGVAEMVDAYPNSNSSPSVTADITIAVYGGLLQLAKETAAQFRLTGKTMNVINARFAKPLDTKTILQPLRNGKMLLTLEEGVLAGGFGSAVLEAANDERLDTRSLVRYGIPDEYIPHGERHELLADIGLTPEQLLIRWT